MRLRWRQLLRWHAWLGWLIGVPLVLWTVTGVVMVARPIDEVRGTDLRAELPALPATTVFPPVIRGGAESLTLKQTGLGPRWIVASGESRYAANPRDGRKLPALTRRQAAAAALAYRRRPAKIVSASLSPTTDPPADLRQPRPAWGVRFDDGARFYVDADTGELLAVRTDFWRFYDAMWGLHIMDLQTREDTHHPILILFTALASIGSLLGCVLMIRRYSRPRRTLG
ncbi:MAG TPA: PepSY domain-containing protein [Novosphingobium sp.]|nr:PepSY domain-containing protein [Novosphingobium sp.]